MDKILEFKRIIENSKSIVFFGGAGVSTESNIPDFRSTDGLYNQKYKYNPETILSNTFFFEHTDEFFEFYKDKMIYKDALPNITHKVLAKLEEEGKLKAVITQNIDGLHQLAGSKNVIELHGTVLKNHCLKCHTFYGIEKIIGSESVPRCEKCGGIIKPDVVLYEEGLNENDIKKALEYISTCDTLIIGGTSLTVYPAAGFVNYFNGKSLIIINKDITNYDKYADLVISDSLGNVFKTLL